jgi:transposase
MTKQKKKQWFAAGQELGVYSADAAGIDVGATRHYVAVPAGRTAEPVRNFGTFTCDLYALADWLRECGIRTVAMESTGVYWIQLYQILEERGFEVKLVNAKAVKHVPGRKSDVRDCEWLQILHSYGLLSGCFRPAAAICVLRSYLRQRELLVRNASAHIQHMQKALTLMNLQLHHVLSDITGVSGLRILWALLKGERDAAKLAALVDWRVKSSQEVIIKSLTGDYRAEHLFALRQALELYEMYRDKIKECDDEIAAYLHTFDTKVSTAPEAAAPRRRPKAKARRNEPHFDAGSELQRISGVDLTEIDGVSAATALTIISEAGLDMHKWPSEKHWSSWLGLCPNNRISGGKLLASQPRKVANRISRALRLGAQSLLRSQSALGAYARRMERKLGTAAAVKATAHKLARFVYSMLKHGHSYVDLGHDYYEQRYKDRVIKNLNRRATALGYQLVAAPSPT